MAAGRVQINTYLDTTSHVTLISKTSATGVRKALGFHKTAREMYGEREGKRRRGGKTQRKRIGVHVQGLRTIPRQ